MTIKSQTQMEGTMTLIETNDKMHLMDFVNCEDARITPFTATCKVQAMRDGNVYITEQKKRKRNTPIFREDNSSLSLGFDGKYYFIFTLPAVFEEELPEKLPHQALVIAQKMVEMLRRKKEGKQ